MSTLDNWIEPAVVLAVGAICGSALGVVWVWFPALHAAYPAATSIGVFAVAGALIAWWAA